MLNERFEPTDPEHGELRPGVMYHQGNLTDFEKHIGLSGDEVLYVGDHIYGDILRSKRDSAWRTVMIIPEMETELRNRHRIAPTIDEWDRYERQLRQISDRLSFDTDLLGRLRAGGEIALFNGDPMTDVTSAVGAFETELKEQTARYHQLVGHCRALERNIDSQFHPRWGSLFKEGNEHSIFGSQVASYACLYTSRVSNFLAYAPTHYFRSPPDYLPHEIQ